MAYTDFTLDSRMAAAQLFNERTSQPVRPVFGCVTTGEDWQFLRLDGQELVIDPSRRYIDRLGSILASLMAGVGLSG